MQMYNTLIKQKTPQMLFGACGVDIWFLFIIQYLFRVLLAIHQGILQLMHRRY